MGKQANDWVDQLAKQGAMMHGDMATHVAEAEAMKRVASDAASWAGLQEAWLADEGLEDAGELAPGLPGEPRVADALRVPRKVVLPSRTAIPLAGDATAAEEEGMASLLRRGHSLQVARREHAGLFLFCSKCGAVAEATARGLRQLCPGKPSTKALREQLSARRRGLFPDRRARRCAIRQVMPATASLARSASSKASHSGNPHSH